MGNTTSESNQGFATLQLLEQHCHQDLCHCFLAIYVLAGNTMSVLLVVKGKLLQLIGIPLLISVEKYVYFDLQLNFASQPTLLM